MAMLEQTPPFLSTMELVFNSCKVVLNRELCFCLLNLLGSPGHGPTYGSGSKD